MSEPKLDIVLFLQGSVTGQSARTIELLSDEGEFLEYRVVYKKPGSAASANQDPDGFDYEQVIEVPQEPSTSGAVALVTPEPDTSPDPDWMDNVTSSGDDALPDLPTNSL